MSNDYTQSRLWQSTLAETIKDNFLDERAALRAAYVQFRAVVEPLAGEIAQSMPMFTDHSIQHIDSLWDTASLLTHSSFPLNPAEAFVLGGAFLLHDLGMGLAAFPDGAATIERDPLYGDLVASALARRLGAETPAEAEEVARLEATATILRLRHAKQAERLVHQTFKTSDGREFQLLENTALRDAFGPTIGRIAHSHWFDVDELPQKFPNIIGSHALHPPDWEVDPLKVACVLRLADAVQVDSRRAPTYLHAFRRPHGVSRDHWYFQERLMRPRPDGDRLEFTSTVAFASDEAPAWWLAFETIRMVDNELRKVDALCADLGRPRFRVKTVAGAESPRRLARYIPVTGWTPVDASLRVSQVSSVVSRLGGKELYGDRPTVALRELIANAADATRARQAQYGGSEVSIWVRLRNLEGQYWLEVEDRGIGMDSTLLVSSLTDFGLSKWSSLDTITEYPGLLAKGFRARGRFGIGFFSVFMVADHVEVLSLKQFQGSSNTSMLVFTDGLNSRPLLKEVDEEHQLRVGGTVVRARLKHPPLTDEGVFGTTESSGSLAQMLQDMLRESCALLDVDLHVQGPEDDEPVKLISGDAWKSMPARELFQQIYPTAGHDPVLKTMYAAWEEVFVENLQELHDENGDIIGRAILAAGLESGGLVDVWWWPSPSAIVFVGGLYADTICDCLGVFAGAPLKADRLSAFPLATTSELKNWAESQANLIKGSRFANAVVRYGAADLARSVGADVPDLPCGFLNSGELLAVNLRDWISRFDEIFLISLYELQVFHREDGSPIFIDRVRGRTLHLPDNALVLDLYARWFFPEEVLKRPLDQRFADFGQLRLRTWNPRHWWYRSGKIGSTGLILEAAIAAWKTEAVALVDNFKFLGYTDEGDERLLLTCADGGDDVRLEAYLLKPPARGSNQRREDRGGRA